MAAAGFCQEAHCTCGAIPRSLQQPSCFRGKRVDIWWVFACQRRYTAMRRRKKLKHPMELRRTCEMAFRSCLNALHFGSTSRLAREYHDKTARARAAPCIGSKLGDYVDTKAARQKDEELPAIHAKYTTYINRDVAKRDVLEATCYRSLSATTNPYEPDAADTAIESSIGLRVAKLEGHPRPMQRLR